MNNLPNTTYKIISEYSDTDLINLGLTNTEIKGLRIGTQIGLYGSYRVARLCGLELKNFFEPGELLEEPTEVDKAFQQYSVKGKSWYESIGESATIPKVLVHTAAAVALYESSIEMALDALLAVCRHDLPWGARIAELWTLSDEPLQQEQGISVLSVLYPQTALERSIDMLCHQSGLSEGAIEEAKRTFEIFGDKDQSIQSQWDNIKGDPIFNRLWKTQTALFNVLLSDNNPVASIEELLAGPDSDVIRMAYETLGVLKDPIYAQRYELIGKYLRK